MSLAHATASTGPRPRGRLLPTAAACGALFLLGSCATPGGGLGDTLGTEVLGTPDAVVFRWSPEHPWDQRLRGNARLRLMANYVAEGGRPVTEALASAQATGQRQLSFRLPTELRGVPAGPVCLFIDEGRDAIPVRTARAPGADTKLFRHPAWESASGGRSRSRAAGSTVATLKARDAELERQESLIQTRMVALGITPTTACEKLDAAPATAEPRPSFPPAQHADLSRKVCVWKARNSAQFHVRQQVRAADGTPARIVVGLDLVALHRAVERDQAGLAPDARGSDEARVRARRLDEGRTFVADAQRFGGLVGQGYRPEVVIGEGKEILPIVYSAQELILRFTRPDVLKPLDEAGRLGLYGVTLDAYRDCIDGVAVQLKADHDASLMRSERDPRRRAAERDRVIGQCRTTLDSLASVRAARERTQADLRAAEGVVASAAGADGRSGAPAEGARLNGNACSIQAGAGGSR